MSVKKRARRVLHTFEPVFPKKSVDETRDALLKLLKLVFTRLGITNEDFGAHHQDWYTTGGGKGSKSPVHTSLNNFRAVMVDKPNISWDQFVKILSGVIRLDIIDISITFRNPFTKDIITVKSNDTFDNQKKKYESEKKKVNKIT